MPLIQHLNRWKLKDLNILEILQKYKILKDF